MSPRLRPVGDRAVLVEFSDRLDPAANAAAIRFEARLRALVWDGVEETAPTIRSVLVVFDPLRLGAQDLEARLTGLLDAEDWMSAKAPAGRLWRIPALYGGDAGPDLPATADALGMTEAEAVAAHAAARQRVTMLGFAPGFAYLAELPEAWNLPRLSHVKPEVPPGAISVAVRQTVMSATAAPTGWRTIARTAFRNFAPERATPFLIEPGDEIVFEPVSEAEHFRLMARAEAGQTVAEPESQA